MNEISKPIFCSDTIYMKCPSLFPRGNKKTIFDLSSAEFARRVVKVKI